MQDWRDAIKVQDRRDAGKEGEKERRYSGQEEEGSRTGRGGGGGMVSANQFLS